VKPDDTKFHPCVVSNSTRPKPNPLSSLLHAHHSPAADIWKGLAAMLAGRRGRRRRRWRSLTGEVRSHSLALRLHVTYATPPSIS
jgi:hypothetical protein